MFHHLDCCGHSFCRAISVLDQPTKEPSQLTMHRCAKLHADTNGTDSAFLVHGQRAIDAVPPVFNGVDCDKRALFLGRED